ncbi:hypothetical protein Patl1_26666 [Pistacia atlantica]|uniref:Uncharacterized protein n=1 Tax=Pistacia atlantica TaxID=434234 RepID=A0ACC1AYT5_9ROSI|nr:hypothetical protein Patl1_26666 [Pistacia atlantica]
MARTNPVTKTPSNSLGFLLLKSHKAAGYLTSIASTFFSLGSVIRRRVTSGRTDANTERGKENGNRALKSRGWHFGAPKLQLEIIFASPLGIKGLFDLLYSQVGFDSRGVSGSSSSVFGQCVHCSVSYPELG